MAHLLEDDAIFVHVPKAAGSSLVQLFRDAGVYRRPINHEHATYHEAVSFMFLRRRGDLLRDARNYLLHLRYARREHYVFGAARHPYTYYPSLYHYLVKRRADGVTDWSMIQGIKRWHPWTPFNDAPLDSFEGFLDFMVESFPSYMTGLYYQYLPPESTHAVRVEQLREDLAKVPVLRDAGALIAGMKVLNQNRHVPDWRPATLDKIYDLERGLLRRFGYEPIGAG